MLVAEQTEKDIDQTRSQYIPVAINTQIMFFCVAAMANIDPMYQYSLEWFVGIFLGGIAQAERAGTVDIIHFSVTGGNHHSCISEMESSNLFHKLRPKALQPI